MADRPIPSAVEVMARAIADPGAFVGLRGDRTTPRWQADAVQVALRAAGYVVEPLPDVATLDERMKAVGMIPLSDLLAGGQPLDKWKAHVGVTSYDRFEEWLLKRYAEFMKMRMSFELGGRDKDDDLFEWVFAHSSALGEVLVNWRAMKDRMLSASAEGGEREMGGVG